MTLYAEYEGILINPSSGGVVEHDRKDEDENILRRALHNDRNRFVSLSDDEDENAPGLPDSSDEDDSLDGVFDIEEPYEYEIDTSRGWLTVATNSIEEIAKQQNKSEKEIEELVSFFINWVTGDPSKIIAQPLYLNCGVSYWQRVLEDDLQKKFASFILPLLSFPACEGVCERAFWYQRRAIGDQRLRSGENTEIHRINYHLQRKQ